MQKVKKFFKIAAILYLVLLILIFLGSYLKYLLKGSWYATATVIAVIFIWVTIFTIATIVTTRAVDLLKQQLRGKDRLDFIARLGTLVADYKKSNQEIEILDFFDQICKENGIMDLPDLNKFYDEKNRLISTREAVYAKLRQEIESAADKHSKNKIK